jgi:hypothetical protein
MNIPTCIRLISECFSGCWGFTDGYLWLFNWFFYTTASAFDCWDSALTVTVQNPGMLHANQIGHKGKIFWFSRHVKSLKIPRFPTRKHNMWFFRWSISTHSLSDPYGFWLRRLQNLPVARVRKWEFTSVRSPGKNHGFEITGLQF